MTTYKKKFGIFHNPDIRKRIEQLDEKRDCQEIVKLLVLYEYPWDIVRSLEIALLYTYASASVSKLLDKTAEFRKYGQKRYDDTAILILSFLESGYDGDLGKRAIERINKTHGNYSIPNDDFLFVLWTFMHFPVTWEYPRRKMTDKEKNAWFNFWYVVGQRMNIQNIPETKEKFDLFIEKYKEKEFIFAKESQEVDVATVNILKGWFPKFIRPLVDPIVYSLVPDDYLKTLKYKKPPIIFKFVSVLGLKVLGIFQRYIVLGKYPFNVINRKDRTYNQKYKIEKLVPEHLKSYEKID